MMAYIKLIIRCVCRGNFGKTISGVLLLIFLNFFHISIAQQIQRSPHAVEIGGGTTLGGISFYGAYVRYIKDESNKPAHGHLPCPGHKEVVRLFPNRMYGKAVLFYESGAKRNIKYKSTGVDLDFYYSLLKIGRSVFVNIKAGVILSTDKMVGVSENSSTTSNPLNYGMLGGAELEWFIVPKFTFVAGVDQRFLFDNKTPLDNPRGFAYGGVRFNFVKKIDRIF